MHSTSMQILIIIAFEVAIFEFSVDFICFCLIDFICFCLIDFICFCLIDFICFCLIIVVISDFKDFLCS